MVTLVCQDDGQPSRTSTKVLTVDVLDVNDNPPRFSHQIYSAEIIENNHVGATVLQVSASDPDAGENAAITYQLTGNGSSYFRFDNSTGSLLANVQLDHEALKELRLRVLAFDGGKPRLSASAAVNILILDANDERPVFHHSSYSFRVFEQRPAGMEVGTVRAEDRDEFPHNQFHYQLQSNDEATLDAFAVDRVKGTIVTKAELDREEKSEHRMLVIARDNGVQTLASTATVTIQVIDVNDNPPRFLFPTTQNGTVVLVGSVRRGQAVAALVCRDPDSGRYAEVVFAITMGNENTLFSVNPKTGVISTTDEIPAPSNADNRTFSLTVMATDLGEVPLRSFATLVIVVKRADPTSFLRRGFLFGAVVFSEQNLSAVVAVCATSGLVIILLLAAIVVVGCRQRPSGQGSTYPQPDRMQAIREEDLVTGLTDSPGSKSSAMLISSEGPGRYAVSPQHAPAPRMGPMNGIGAGQAGLGTPSGYGRMNGSKAIEVRLLDNGVTRCQTVHCSSS